MNNAPRPRPLSVSRRLLFAAATILLLIGLIGAGLTVWNVRELREIVRLRQMMHRRIAGQSLADFAQGAPPERLEHLRACYLHPDRIRLDQIPWNLLNRPTPFLGYAPEPGRQQEGQFNSQQLREAREVTLPKPPGVYRIFLVGGSLAYSVGAPDQNSTISACLERLLNERQLWPGRRVEVFNAAVCGYTSTHERIMIENRLVEWQPDLVLALSGVNDGHFGFDGRNSLDFRGYEDELFLELINSSMRRAGLSPYPLAPPMAALAKLPATLVADRFVRNARLSAQALETVHARYCLALQPILSDRIKTLSPGEKRWLATEPAGKVDYLAAVYAAIGQALAAPATPPPANLRMLDVQTAFTGHTDPIYLDLFHVADKGNELLARRLADELARTITGQ